jgi:hypothetical protein
MKILIALGVLAAVLVYRRHKSNQLTSPIGTFLEDTPDRRRLMGRAISEQNYVLFGD